MKKLEFKTSKGSFMLVDIPLDVTHVNKIGMVKFEDDFNYTPIFSKNISLISNLKEITENKASVIIDGFLDLNNVFGCCEKKYKKNSSIETLYSYLTQKGVYLFENKIGSIYAEQQTFYNPVIFKL